MKQTRVEKRYRKYTPDVLFKAYQQVKDRGISVEKAARMFGVPSQTLRDRVFGNIDPEKYSMGGETMFSKEEEQTLVSHVETLAELGYGYTNLRLKQLAGELAFELGKRESNKPLSNNWLAGFLRRWSGRLSSVNPRKLESSRAKSSTPEVLEKYFNNLKDVLQENDLLDKPHLIFNLNETGLQPDHRPPNIIANPKTKPQAISSPRSTTTTLIACVNALGNSLPPFYIFKGKRFNPELMKGATAGSKGVMSESGWSNAQIFKEYLETHFMPYVKPAASTQKIILIYDGHSSHKPPQLINWAKEQGLILFVLPAHSSHILQPIDVSVFGPFKNYYYGECLSYMFYNLGKVVTKYDICSLSSKAYLRAMTPSNIQAGFRKTGIFPLNKDAVSAEKLIPCETFRESNPIQNVKAQKAGKEAMEEFLRIKEERQHQEHPASQCSCGKKKSTVTRPNAGGVNITGETYIKEISAYETIKKTFPSKKNDNKKCQTSPKPSTSGLNLNKSIHHNTDTDSSSEDDVAENDLCCVCKKMSPPCKNSYSELKIVNWAQCDQCQHWVHLAICTATRVVRRQSTFLCPHCT